MPYSTIPAPIAAALLARGYTEPTPVQAAVIEPQAEGRDLLVSAQTGSGKTVAFGMAMAGQLLSNDGALPHAGAPLALVIAPTRELALQVSKELSWLYADVRARITNCVGGMDAVKERRALQQGTHIVVGTPGRLRDHLERGALDLSALQFVVLDEADEMLDMGFREDLEEILDATSPERRTLMFSATMPRPIVAMAKRYQRDALAISTIDEREGHGDISYQVVAVAPADIQNAVVNLLRFHEAETAMLFCATRESVRRLHGTLLERGFAAVALSGEHSQSERNHALQALRDGRARVCVATDVAARGIDVATLSLVIHAELPRDADTLKHRSGRTGRAGRKGTAVLVMPYPHRRRVEMMLRGARIDAEWMEAPTPESIRKKDRERLLAVLMEPVEASEEETGIAERLLADRTPTDIAVALVRAHMAKMPQPEELIDLSREGATKSHHRPGFEDVVWFRMDIGRRQKADVRWLMPLICRRGHITRNEIGAIRISGTETHFQVQRAVEAKFNAALQRTAREGAEDETGIHIERSPDQPREERSAGPRSNAAGPRPHSPKAHGERAHGDRPQGDRPQYSGKPHSAKPHAAKPHAAKAWRPEGQRKGPFADPQGGPRGK